MRSRFVSNANRRERLLLAAEEVCHERTAVRTLRLRRLAASHDWQYATVATRAYVEAWIDMRVKQLVEGPKGATIV